MIRWFVAGVVALVFMAPVVAKDVQPEVVRDIPTFLQKQAALRGEIEQSKKYAHVKPEAKKKIFSAQDQIANVLKGHQTIDELTADEKVVVFNAQTEILAQLNDAEADRVICSNEARTGSHLPTVMCTTKRERDQQREAIRNTYPAAFAPNCGIGCSGR